MRPAALPTPGIIAGSYPERDNFSVKRVSGVPLSTKRRLVGSAEQTQHAGFLSRVHAHDSRLLALSETAFDSCVKSIRIRLSTEGFSADAAAEAFAVVREAARRQLGQPHYDTQLIAGRIMLGNQLAEMATGEGKTLAAVLTAATTALAGMPVHVITANDYLVTRDADLLRPVYGAVGLTVGAVTQPMNQEQRRVAYACDITYCTAKELVFDYLRDRVVRRRVASDLHERVRRLDGESAGAATPGTGLLLHGLWMALIDEADSILIDEARTPLILAQSRVNTQQQHYFEQALKTSARLDPRTDFVLDQGSLNAKLTDAGCEKLAKQAGGVGGLWNDRRHREEVMRFALAARYLFVRDRHYLVRDGEVLIIDQTTGRLAPGRAWSRGLQQLIEVKEACVLTGDQETIAQITYQRFFPRYLRIGGMSGTLQEAASELSSIYGLSIMRVPLRKSSRRRTLPIRLMAKPDDKWRAVVKRVKELSAARRPVLIGTDSVADSDELSQRLTAINLSHTVLNARNDGEEAAIVSHAGQVGQIVVTTNMAGRGTDIALGPGVSAIGGLYVISCQLNPSARIDRQLHGRCARQGDPGTVETILSLEDTLVAQYWPAWLRAVLRKLANPRSGVPAWLGKALAWMPQKVEDRHERYQRKMLLKHDEQAERRLSFAGRGE